MTVHQYRISPSYALEKEYPDKEGAEKSWFAHRSEGDDKTPQDNEKASPSHKTRQRVLMSRSMIIDVDAGRRSDRAEVALLHHDLAHNPTNGFNFQIQWLGTTARFIEDLVQSWTRAVERYGLRLIEAPINQIKDVSKHNPFQAPLPISLALHPPPSNVYRNLLPAHVSSLQFFEYVLLRRFGFILDQEASDMYLNISKDVIIEYKSRPNQFDYSQFVHRSGVAFVQVLPNNEGFLWLDNRLYNSHTHGGTPSSHPGVQSATSPIITGNVGSFTADNSSNTFPSADAVRREFMEFCSDIDRLEVFYRKELERLQMQAEVENSNESGHGSPHDAVSLKD